MTPDSWSGLGLLKAIRFINTMSFHFLHFAIQEYLAAYHITSLSNNNQIKLLKRTFWEAHYYNTWIMYVEITGGEQFAWKHLFLVTGFNCLHGFLELLQFLKGYNVIELNAFTCFNAMQKSVVMKILANCLMGK